MKEWTALLIALAVLIGAGAVFVWIAVDRVAPL
jgi:hypothetical protein